MSSVILEICVDNIESACIAQEAGAHRLELCSALELGGLTPSAGLVALAKQKVSIPVFMMIRPRAGNFYFTEEEGAQMLKDIEVGLSLGADGFVTGALKKEDGNEIDKDLCGKLIRAAEGKPVTFHRAFDLLTKDISDALYDVIELGFSRILTSGRKHTAMEGINLLQTLVELASSKSVIIVVASGVCESNIKDLHLTIKAKEYHSSGRFHNIEMDDEPPIVAGTSHYFKANFCIVQAIRRNLDLAVL